MTKFRALLMMCAISGFVGAGAINADAAKSKTSGAAQSAAPLTTDELVELYHGRSWLWKDGAGLGQTAAIYRLEPRKRLPFIC